MATVQKLRDATPDELVRRAIDLRPMIADNAADNEKNRRLSQDVFDTIRDADFFRYYQPRKFGGLEFDQPAPAMQCVIEWASADASTGW
ncbi:unnamed protein product, partial [Discosporangium mesarthrocarpum]